MINADLAAHLRQDAYAHWLGATIEAIEPGYSRVSLMVTESMLNFHGTTHGGIIFGLGDIAFAAASNSHGTTAVALNVSISFIRPTQAGDHLVAEAKEINLGGAKALYEITVMNNTYDFFYQRLLTIYQVHRGKYKNNPNSNHMCCMWSTT